MKLGRFRTADGINLGKLAGDQIVDLTAAGYGTSMRDLLTRLPEIRDEIAAVDGPTVPLKGATLEAPIADPQKFLALGMNYKEHADGARKAGIPVPDSQLWFNKQVSCINGPYHDIDLPKVSEKLDYEAELAVIIGKRCKHVDPARYREVVAGYAVANDVSVRDWQLRSPTFTLGKSFDTHGPFGPWITTDDEVDDPQALPILAHVNGEVRQDSNTDDMIYSIAEQIAYISTAFTLEPGDVLLTGTPSGVGIETGVFLKEGDVVRIEIGNLGHIENKVAVLG
ncbi:fumarylacetoacetate hydrolase family protein [Marivita sp.]|uniref:fumarylacetoacetate hydrolase family protein n=1 Tax=Marivita sp. TaxID=2003365 RepID=UPI003A8629B0